MTVFTYSDAQWAEASYATSDSDFTDSDLYDGEFDDEFAVPELSDRRPHGVASPDTMSLALLQCILAGVIAVLVLFVLSSLGVSGHVESECPEGPAYSGCAVLQDFRSLMSFLIGGLLCVYMTVCREDGTATAASFCPFAMVERVQLYAYMM